MLKALSNDLTWYKMQGYNDLNKYHQKTTKNHSKKMEENKKNLAGLTVLIFGSKLILRFRMS